MNKTLFSIIILSLALIFSTACAAREFSSPLLSQVSTAATDVQGELPFAVGERLCYDVYFNNLKIGKSELIFNGIKIINKKKVYHITFITDVVGFYDVEEIYAHTQTFLPLRIERTIKQAAIFPVRITEIYDQTKHKVTIRKSGRVFANTKVIKKTSPIQNAILLPYFYRVQPALKKGETFKITLPVADFTVMYRKKEEIETSLGTFSAYLIASEPEKFSFWLSADKRRLPLRIESLTAIGYSLKLVSIETGAPQE